MLVVRLRPIEAMLSARLISEKVLMLRSSDVWSAWCASTPDELYSCDA